MSEQSIEKTKNGSRTPRGFAAASPERRREIASAGGKAAHASGRAHRFTPKEARAAGSKGGEKTARRPGHMAEIGRKGGQSLSRDREHRAAIGCEGGAAVSRDREHMAEIGRRGGKGRAAQRASKREEQTS